MRDISQSQAHLLLLYRLIGVCEVIEFRADDHHREGKRLDLIAIVMLLPDCRTKALLVLVKLLLLLGGQLLLDLLNTLLHRLPNRCEPEKQVVYRCTRVGEVYDDAHHQVPTCQ